MLNSTSPYGRRLTNLTSEYNIDTNIYIPGYILQILGVLGVKNVILLNLLHNP